MPCVPRRSGLGAGHFAGGHQRRAAAGVADDRAQTLRGASITDLESGAPAGRSWLLLGGLIPVDFDDLCISELGPERRLLERSQMGIMELWQHERRVESTSEATCTLSDVLDFQLRAPLRRLPGTERLATAIVRALVRHRRRRLAELHGAS